jgi:tryptophan synthase alpha chain
MNRYYNTFSRLGSENRIAFIPFAVAGDPGIATSESIFKTYIDAGADILEIGYPFSDPIADGPVNQRASMRSIAAGLDHVSFFNLIKRLRRYTDIPFGLLCYANTMQSIGFLSFCRRAAEAGLDSILAADIPPEENAGFSMSINSTGLDSVYIVSELTPENRIKKICSLVTGFVYVVSRLGVTGTQKELNTGVSRILARIKKATDKPLCDGFGISRPEHVAQIKRAGANGAIVGSALVSIIENNLDNKTKMLSTLGRRVRAFRAAA